MKRIIKDIKRSKPLLNLEDVLSRTFSRKRQLKYFQDILDDVKKDDRIKAQECQLCFYDPKLGGAAMTESECRICSKPMMFGNTNTDDLCIECAKKHKLCKHCSADIELKNRKKL